MDAFGCEKLKLEHDRELAGSGIRICRRRSYDPHLGQVETPASGRGVLVGVSLRAGHCRRILHPSHSSSHEFGAGSIYVRNFADRYRADLDGAFDFLLLEVSSDALRGAVSDDGPAPTAELSMVAGIDDIVLAGLAHVAMPLLARPAEANPLFLDQLALALGAHLVGRYGDRKQPQTGHAGLSRAKFEKAKEMLDANLGGDIHISEVAEVCGLSPSHFARSFRETSGETPHRWLISRRIERARMLLSRTELALADIAATCGFADQSHFTRIFSRDVGCAPSAWRRINRDR